MLVSVWGLAGCSMKAKPAQSTAFLPAETPLTKAADLPFQRTWRKPDVDWSYYTHIYVAPVNTDHLIAMTKWQRAGRGHKMAQDAQELAAYTQHALQEAFRKRTQSRLILVEEPSAEHGLILEFALTEIVPSKVSLNALGYAPFAGAAARLLRSGTSRSTVAFEARVRDAATHDVIALFADREAEQMAIINVQDFTWYGHAKGIVKDWSGQLAQVLEHPDRVVVKDTKPFTLKPW